MPRIAVGLTVLAAAAFSIGFNIVRYPIVWEQLAAVEDFAASTDPAAANVEPDGSTLSAENDPLEQRVTASIAGSLAELHDTDMSLAPRDQSDDTNRSPHAEFAELPRNPRRGEPRRAVRPLPSVNDWAANPHAADRPWSSQPILSYPSTGK